MRILFYALLAIFPFFGFAQPKESRQDNGSVTQQEGPNSKSVLFRGRVAYRYNLRYTGTYYWNDEVFERGFIVMDGKRYDDVLVNLDAFRQGALVKYNANGTAITPRTDQVDSLMIGDSKFVNLKKKGYDVPEGFYEVLCEEGFALYMHVAKSLVVDGNSLQTGHYTGDMFNDLITYYVERDGKLMKVKKHKAKKYLNGGREYAYSKKMSRKSILASVEARPAELIPALPDSLRLASASIPEGNFSVGSKTIFTGLPVDYFSDNSKKEKDDELLKLINAGNEMAVFANKLYEIGSPDKASGSNAYVQGTVRDVLTGEPLVGVAVTDERSKTYAMTDASGFYQLRMPVGESVLGFSGYSLDDLHLNVIVYGDGGLDVQMKEKITSLRGAVVSAESMVNHRDPRMGIEKIRTDVITKVPSAFGESDILKVVLTLPGVKSTGEAAGGFNVRGGSTDQNLILFNDGTIYNPTHLFGIFSAFNTDVINDIELYKSSIPAEFGGRISSVLDVRGRDGNSNKVTGSAGIGLLTSRFHLEGPVGNDKTTFILGGRTTYSNWIFNLLPEESSYAGGQASFSDLNASVTRKLGSRNTLHAYGYWSRDAFSFTKDTTFHYSNLNASLKLHSVLSERTSLTTVGGYDKYSNVLDNAFNEFSGYSVATGIDQWFAKMNAKTVVTHSHTLSYGANAIYYDLNPGHRTPLGINSLVMDHAMDRQNAVEGAVYLSDTWQPHHKLTFDMGIRYSGYSALGEYKQFFGSPEYRISGKYSILGNLSLKAGYNSMNQYIHLISNTSAVSPMDAWHLADSRVRPQEGWQAASGIYWTLPENQIDFSIEGYYKEMSHYLDYKSGAVLVMNDNLTDDLVGTYGKAYGVEFMVKKALGKLNGWMSYTYSRAFLREMEDRGVNTINSGDWYQAAHDKPHDFKLVSNYKFTHRYSLSVNVDYSTGRPVTIPVATYIYGGGTRLSYSSRNGYRVPDYFRMDLAFNMEPSHYLRQFQHMSVTLGVYNVTGRQNAYSVYYTTHGGSSLQGYKLSVFACPIPYINLNIKFG